MYNSDEALLFSAKAEKGLCSHAYIIDGAQGIGKLDFALGCAKTMLCQSEKKPCGICPSCQKAASNNHPDIFIIGYEKTAAIADVREIIRRSTLKPNDGEKQIFIVCNAGKLRSEAQNALLKLFEEPPETVAVFLLTESRSALLPTVLSRGQRIHLDGMRDHELLEKLSQKFASIPKEQLKTAVSVANGNYGEAEKYLSKERTNLRKKAESLLTFVLSKQSYEVTSALVIPKYKREQLYALLAEFVSLVGEAQKQKYGVAVNTAPQSEECSALLASTNKKALAYMGEAALVCMMSLENHANVSLAASKLSVDLLRGANK